MSKKPSAIVTAYYSESDRAMIVWHLNGDREILGLDALPERVRGAAHWASYVDDDAWEDMMEAIHDWEAARSEHYAYIW